MAVLHWTTTVQKLVVSKEHIMRVLCSSQGPGGVCVSKALGRMPLAQSEARAGIQRHAHFCISAAVVSESASRVAPNISHRRPAKRTNARSEGNEWPWLVCLLGANREPWGTTTSCALYIVGTMCSKQYRCRRNYFHRQVYS